MPRPSPLIAALAVMAVAVAASVLCLANQFTLDDAGLILGTERLHGLARWKEILTSPYWPPPYAQDLYRPLTSLLLALQYQLGGGNPALFRVVSVLLYAGASLAVLHLAWRLLPPAVALATALLFAAHPVHVEATVLAVAQGELVIALLGAVMVARYLDRRRSAAGALSPGDWMFLGGLYLIACLTKEQGLLLPALLLAAELCLVAAPSWSERLRRTGPGYAGLAVLGGLVLFIRGRILSGNPFLAAPAEALVGVPIEGRALTMLQVVPEWFRLLVWPAHLRSDYSPAEFLASTGWGPAEIAGLLLLLGAVAIAWLARRRAPVVTFGLLCCAITLFPVSNLIVPTGILLAERTLFSPSIGFLIAAGGAFHWLLARERPEPRLLRPALVLATLVLVALGTVRSASRQKVFRNQATLNVASARDAPKSARVQQALGETLFDQGNRAEAVAAYRRAIAYGREPWTLRIALARRYRMVGDEEAALEELRQSLAERPTRDALAELAAAFLAVGMYREAGKIADGIIASDNAPPVMVWIKHLADSAIAVNAPPGSIKVGIRTP
ncbi:MAG TPA: tetratricopeptide repeat protein [Gemmatimonadales bacterium]|nr:tetratricopeptide repeat protein [Gemmatimonadales bacterium]